MIKKTAIVAVWPFISFSTLWWKGGTLAGRFTYHLNHKEVLEGE
jgi:hypothetical protein